MSYIQGIIIIGLLATILWVLIGIFFFPPRS